MAYIVNYVVSLYAIVLSIRNASLEDALFLCFTYIFASVVF